MILDKVKATIKKYNLINKSDTIVIGVSGGADSVALFYLLCSLKKEFRLNLHVAHLDHMIRKDSDKDARFVKKLAEKRKIPVTTAQINVKGLSKKGSLEEVARRVRLGFLFKVARDIKSKKIALGHNLDDQAETVLMRILRGAGLYGLNGILPKREISGFQVIRPLIEVKRKEIESYLNKRHIDRCLDASNLEDIYFRNKVRNRLLPLLAREYNKNIKEVLSNMAECVGFDYDYLNRATQRLVKARRHRLSLERLKRMHPAILRLALRRSIASIAGDTRRITFKHIKEIEDLILNRPSGSIVDLPKGISVLKKAASLSFYRRK
jgi:tRNA(Ile)-lysidine synthase